MPTGTSPTLEQLSTVVRNKTTSAKTFSFLPPHGRTLQGGQQVEIKGDLLAILSRPGNGRKLKGMQAAIAANVFEIMKSPPLSFYDPVRGTVHTIAVSDGEVIVAAPDRSFDSSSLQSLDYPGSIVPG
jgi:hypothetical protein